MSRLKRYFLALFVIAMTGHFLWAGNQTDSLEKALSETNDLEKKLEIYTLLIKQYQTTDLPHAKSLTAKALALSKSTGNETYLGELYGLLGDMAVVQDSLDKAAHYYEISLEYFRESNDPGNMAGVCMVLGNIALTHENLPAAMQYYLETVNYAQQAKQEVWLPSVYINIGSIYVKTGQLNMAQDYLTRSIELSSGTDKPMLTADAYLNLGTTYLVIGNNEIAKDYYNKALSIYTERNAPMQIAKTKQELAKVNFNENKYRLALEQLEQAEDLLRQDDPGYAGPRQTLWAENFIEKGKNQLLGGEIDQANANLLQGLLLSMKTGQLNQSRNAAQYLSKLWETKGIADSTLKYFRLYKTFSDSLTNEESIRKLALQEAQFNYEQDLLLEKQKRERESEINQRNIYLLLTAILILILLLVVLSLFLKLSRNKTKQAELEQKALKAELDLRNKELTTHLVYQVKNNEFILNISKQLKIFLAKASPENKSMVNELIKQIEFDSTTDQWEEFEIRFQQVHTDFYKKLSKKFPDLSSNELRLCAFLKLNMNTKDIASITYQSTNSITVARWRLRQKLGISKEESLTAYLMQF